MTKDNEINQKEKVFNSHFIQKAFVKQFYGTNIVNSIKVSDMTTKVINTNNKHNEIVIRGFHSEKIERGMNDLEREGVELVVTINNLINTGMPVNLSRKDSLVLRFYLSLNSLRTNLIRGMIEKNKFERPVMNSVRGAEFTAKGVHEESINILMMMYRKLKSGQDWRTVITIAETKSRLFGVNALNVNEKTAIEIGGAIDSALVFGAANEGEFLLQEIMTAQERSLDPISVPVFDFHPISSKNVVFMVRIYNPEYNSGRLTKPSHILGKLLDRKPIVEYKGADKLGEMYKSFVSQNKILDKVTLDFKFKQSIRDGFYTMEDVIKYPTIKPTKVMVDSLNAVCSFFNKDGLVFYKDLKSVDSMLLMKKILRNDF